MLINNGFWVSNVTKNVDEKSYYENADDECQKSIKHFICMYVCMYDIATATTSIN